MRERVGPYRILRTLGQGGMGVVYEASDERDDRPERRVALKMLLPSTDGPDLRERLRREARTAAAVRHPHVCEIYEVGEDGELYVAMELLDGEPLSTRISRGPIPVGDAVTFAQQILSALSALHESAALHRDVKPSNVFLTSHGVKLLDFGLAAPIETGVTLEQRLTLTGVVLGTPQYMAPERWTGDGQLGPESDLFAVGALLFEMVTGRAAFSGRSPIEVAQAVLAGPAPSLEGGPGVDGLDRVVRTALAKRPADRYPTAGSMSSALTQATQSLARTAQVRPTRAATRLLVFPFRLLRPDPEMELFGHGIADAVTTALSALRSLVMRSTHVAARFKEAAPDLAVVAREAGVDAVLIGTILRSGSRIRVSAQLLEVPAGTVLWSDRLDAEQDDLLTLQDELERRIVEGLSLSLSERDNSGIQRMTPATPRANELFMRANRISPVVEMLPTARDLYLKCVEEDPRFAPAWAQLGRTYRVLGKYGFAASADSLRLAEQAFQRSLELDPDLSLAHHLYAYFEIEERGHATSAMLALLDRARDRPAEADLFAALVLACRFCGLLDASVAADARARRLEPGIRTSVAFTHWMRGDLEAALALDDESLRWLRLYLLPQLGREDEARAVALDMESRASPGVLPMVRTTGAALRRDRAGCLAATETVVARGLRDPESLYICARNLSHVGETARGLELLGQAVAGGLHTAGAFRRDPWLAEVRGDERFEKLLFTAEAGRAASLAAFRSSGGGFVLGRLEGTTAS